MLKHDEPEKGAVVETLEVDAESERKLLRKIDMHLVPFMMALYLFSFLDRGNYFSPELISASSPCFLTFLRSSECLLEYVSYAVNIGNARLYNLERDLHLTGSQYQLAVSILNVPFCLLEVPSNLVLRKFTPSRYLAIITTLWGIIATLTGITQNLGGLLVCRIALGIVEAGLFPGLVAYMTLWYTKSELALRIGYLFSAAALAGAYVDVFAFLLPSPGSLHPTLITSNLSDLGVFLPTASAFLTDMQDSPGGAGYSSSKDCLASSSGFWSGSCLQMTRIPPISSPNKRKLSRVLADDAILARLIRLNSFTRVTL